jgi:hypothetical protein
MMVKQHDYCSRGRTGKILKTSLGSLSYEAIFGKRSIQRGKNITVERDENTRAVEERPRREEGWGISELNGNQGQRGNKKGRTRSTQGNLSAIVGMCGIRKEIRQQMRE